MESSDKKSIAKKILGVVGIGILLFAGLILLNRTFFQTDDTSSSTTAISGQLDINGVIPRGATLTFMQREVSSDGGFNDFSSVVNPEDGASWSFNNAIRNKSYVIQGVIRSSNGVELVRSNQLTVTAPASNEVLTFNLRQEGLTGVAEISGIVKVNGYYPVGSTVSILGRSVNTDDFKVVVEGIPAFSEKIMKYDKAVAGLRYEVVGYLYDSGGKQIGESNVLSVVAPAVNETLIINSNAKDPNTQNAVISGIIDLNGGVGSNTRIVILQRQKGQQNFSVAVDNIQPIDGVSWSWNGGRSGTWYDMIAVLKERQANGTDKDVAKSEQLTVAAPAVNVGFRLDSGVAQPNPIGEVRVSCQVLAEGSQIWTAQVTFPYVADARSYWYQIGTSSNTSDMLNETRTSTNINGEVFDVKFTNRQNYYARFATSSHENLPVGSSQFSGFSSDSVLLCTN